jgi:anhydro-N-acetylmuramic acid kinase
MSQKTLQTAIGMMSGTSLDGVDAALIRGDGEIITEFGPSIYLAYSPEQRQQIRALLNLVQEKGSAARGNDAVQQVERLITEHHVAAIETLLSENGVDASSIDVLGMHGQTVLHRPDEGWTWQIGDGDYLAEQTGIPVVDDFRSADMKAGGQGAPFAPLYHEALIGSAGLEAAAYPVVVVNIGGVANLTWVKPGEDVIGFDVGPGNAQMDDWAVDKLGASFDENGQLAANGKAEQAIVRQVIALPFFSENYPKSLDRLDFSLGPVVHLPAEDGMATLAAITVAGIMHGIDLLPEKPASLYICGGGRKNTHLMQLLEQASGLKPQPVDVLGWRGDMLEAELFGHLAIRSLKGLPLSLPSTTGARKAVTGGVLHHPPVKLSA